MPSDRSLVIGQHRVKEILRSTLRNGRVGHAYLFWGAEGVGKDALAMEFAAALLCDKGSEEPCGECPSCRKMALLQHPNCSVIVPLPGKENGRKEDDDVEPAVLREIREQTARKAQDPYFHIDIPKAKFITIGSIRGLKKESSLSSIDAGRKLFLIFDADAMNDQAANAVLKVLEEPTEGIVFLLTTSRIDRVKETIRSRCHLVHCSTLTEDEIAEALRTREGVEEQQARSIARLANGSYRTARALLGEELQRSRADAVQFLRTVLGHSPIKIAEAVDDYRSAANRDDAERLIQSLLVWFRDAVMMREQAESMIINADQQDDLRRFVSRFGDGDLERCIGAAERALELLARNVYLPLVVVSLSAHIRRILHAE